MPTSHKHATHQKVKEQSDELRTQYPIFTAILEIIPDMDLNEVHSVLVMVDSARSLLMTHATRLTLIGEDKNFDQIIEENLDYKIPLMCNTLIFFNILMVLPITLSILVVILLFILGEKAYL